MVECFWTHIPHWVVMMRPVSVVPPPFIVLMESVSELLDNKEINLQSVRWWKHVGLLWSGAEWNRRGTVSRRSWREPCFLTNMRKREFTRFNPLNPSFFICLFHCLHPLIPVSPCLFVEPCFDCSSNRMAFVPFRQFIMSCLTVQLIPLNVRQSFRRYCQTKIHPATQPAD